MQQESVALLRPDDDQMFPDDRRAGNHCLKLWALRQRSHTSWLQHRQLIDLELARPLHNAQDPPLQRTLQAHLLYNLRPHENDHLQLCRQYEWARADALGYHFNRLSQPLQISGYGLQYLYDAGDTKSEKQAITK